MVSLALRYVLEPISRLCRPGFPRGHDAPRFSPRRGGGVVGGVLCGFLRSFSGEWCRVYTLSYIRVVWHGGAAFLPYIVRGHLVDRASGVLVVSRL